MATQSPAPANESAVREKAADQKAAEPRAAGQKYVEFDEYIDYHLSRAQSGIRAADLATALAIAAVLITAYLFVFVLADHWLVEHGVSQTARLWGFFGLIALIAAYFAFKIITPSLRRVTNLFAAKEIEHAQPELRQSLLTLVDVRNSGRDVNPKILEVLQKRTAVSIDEGTVNRAIDRKLLLRSSIAVLALVAAMSVYAVASPKSIGVSLLLLRRAFVGGGRRLFLAVTVGCAAAAS